MYKFKQKNSRKIIEKEIGLEKHTDTSAMTRAIRA
jgi:hypothetical protein